MIESGRLCVSRCASISSLHVKSSRRSLTWQICGALKASLRCWCPYLSRVAGLQSPSNMLSRWAVRTQNDGIHVWRTHVCLRGTLNPHAFRRYQLTLPLRQPRLLLMSSLLNVQCYFMWLCGADLKNVNMDALSSRSSVPVRNLIRWLKASQNTFSWFAADFCNSCSDQPHAPQQQPCRNILHALLSLECAGWILP